MGARRARARRKAAPLTACRRSPLAPAGHRHPRAGLAPSAWAAEPSTRATAAKNANARAMWRWVPSAQAHGRCSRAGHAGAVPGCALGLFAAAAFQRGRGRPLPRPGGAPRESERPLPHAEAAAAPPTPLHPLPPFRGLPSPPPCALAPALPTFAAAGAVRRVVPSERRTRCSRAAASSLLWAAYQPLLPVHAAVRTHSPCGGWLTGAAASA